MFLLMKKTNQMVYDSATSNSSDELDCFKWVINNKMFLSKDMTNSSYVRKGGFFSPTPVLPLHILIDLMFESFKGRVLE